MKLPSRHAAIGYVCSATLHAGLIACVVWWVVPVWVQKAATEPVIQTAVARQLDERTEDAAARDVNPVAQVTTSSAQQAADRTSVESPPAADSPGLAAFARKRFERARRETEDVSPEQQFDDLESLARRLKQVSNEPSVQELSGTLSDWLGANERDTTPAQGSDEDGADFDIGTAQISDVKQVTTQQGVTYIAVLVDAQGNSIETPLDEADGPQLYKTFQLIKRFPLLESVYRSAVMGLLDKLAAPPREAVESEPQPPPKSDHQQK